MNPKSNLRRPALLATITLPVLSFVAPTAGVGAIFDSDWVGNGNPTGDTGNWSQSALWSPVGVPNNSGGNVYNVTIKADPNSATFNGPKLDIDVTIQNLELIDTAFLENQPTPGTNLTVTGSTTFTTAPGNPFLYGAIYSTGGTHNLGTLTNFNSVTKVLDAGFLVALNGGTIAFRGADIVTNFGVLNVTGATSRIINSDTGTNAFANLAVNNSTLELRDGATFTTAGNFTNNGGFDVTTSNDFALATSFTISGAFTNFDPGTKTLSGGFGFIVDSSFGGGTATLRFPGADIRTISGTTVRVLGPGASITDLGGTDGLRNLRRIENGSFSSGGTRTYQPDGLSGGTFTGANATHTIATGAIITVDGDYETQDSTTNIEAPSDSADTRFIINGSALINGGSIDMGGQPGVNTQYHTELQVIGGLEFRGAFLTGTGTTFADIAILQGSNVSPGNSAGALAVVGALSFDSTSTLTIELGGLTPGLEFDLVSQTGPEDVTLGGDLFLYLIDGFQSSVASTDTFEILTSENAILGAFVNVESGERVPTADGFGSFLVSYGVTSAAPEKVVLSDFQPVPEPTTAALGLAGLAMLALRRRARGR